MDKDLLAKLKATLAKIDELNELLSALKTQKFYCVSMTNADLEQVSLQCRTLSFDIAESVADKLFAEWEYMQDFMIYDERSQEVFGLWLSEETKRLRGECQG
jgi:hypothetical protein